jgi:hypothetical protein
LKIIFLLVELFFSVFLVVLAVSERSRTAAETTNPPRHNGKAIYTLFGFAKLKGGSSTSSLTAYKELVFFGG